jgi:hypothetical protein
MWSVASIRISGVIKIAANTDLNFDPVFVQTF